MLESKVQVAPLTKNVIIAVLTPKSVIQLTAVIAFETGRKPNSACCNYVHFSHQPLVSVAHREVSQVYRTIIVTRCTDLQFLCASTKMMMILITNVV